MRWARLELTLRLRELLRVVLSMRCCMRLRLQLRLLSTHFSNSLPASSHGEHTAGK
jgi:hypothetical protein